MLEIDSLRKYSIKDTSHAGQIVFEDNAEQARRLLADSDPTLVERLLHADDSYDLRFLIGLLLSATPWSKLTPSVRSELDVTYSEKPSIIQPFYGYWSLCPSSEGKLIDSLVDRSAMLVNDCLLVKKKVYTTALALRTVSTNQGTFFEGGWYSPINETMGIVSEQLDRGTEHLELNTSEWAYMRDITRYASPEAAKEVMRRAQAYTPIT